MGMGMKSKIVCGVECVEVKILAPMGDVNTNHPEVGNVYPSPSGDGLVYVTDGQYWRAPGISNFWYWREILTDGTLSEKEDSGYGYELLP